MILRPGTDTKLFAYKGRVGRLRYLGMSFVVIFLLLFALFILGFAAMMLESYALFFLLLPIGAGAAVVQTLLGIRRLHDFDHSGWWYVPCLVVMSVGAQVASSGDPTLAAIGAVLYLAPTLILLLKPGTEGPNRFGPPPTGEDPVLSPT